MAAKIRKNDLVEVVRGRTSDEKALAKRGVLAETDANALLGLGVDQSDLRQGDGGFEQGKEI